MVRDKAIIYHTNIFIEHNHAISCIWFEKIKGKAQFFTMDQIHSVMASRSIFGIFLENSL